MAAQAVIRPSGDSWVIRSGSHEAEVVQLGGAVRRYAVGGLDVLAAFPAGAKPDAGRGQVLMPWPNRVRDGKFTFDGRSEQLALSEPKNSNAIHGLARWTTWSLLRRSEDAVTVGLRLLSGQGWDWPLELAMTYRVGEFGLHVEASATNIGDAVAPFGYGHHPYLTAGETNLDDAILTVPADSFIEVDDRSLPVGTSAVSGDTDLRAGKSLKGIELDTAFTDLIAVDGRWQVTLASGNRRTLLWAETDAFPYAQCFTADKLPGGKARTTGLAVEPMTCPADAFNSGEHLLRLEPGQTWTGHWGVQTVLPDAVSS